ncbi:hypothetical protein [Caulobacter sp. S45]|nr:hypothetical protein [Caulobacter sp. S45]
MTADDRQARLAAALRANLRRRKAAVLPPPADSEAERAPSAGEPRKPE